MSNTTWTPIPGQRHMFAGTVAGHPVTRDINDLFEFDHVIEVTAAGTLVEADAHGLYDMYVTLDADGEAVPNSDAALIATATRQGWTLLTGHSGQDRYNGPVMHQSEVLGGGLADFVLAHPGTYVIVMIDAMPDDEDVDIDSIGWAIARRND